jgi:hypothetical protein
VRSSSSTRNRPAPAAASPNRTIQAQIRRRAGFGDQHDKAQRVQKTGYGVRLPTYSFEEQDLFAALSMLLIDDVLRERVAAAGESLRRRTGTALAAGLIERVVESGEPVIRRG